MVEINKSYSGLARISVVNEQGELIIDHFCKPDGIITDYRYEITGIKREDLESGLSFDEIRKIVIILY
jgi:RNA exonuclease 4